MLLEHDTDQGPVKDVLQLATAYGSFVRHALGFNLCLGCPFAPHPACAECASLVTRR